ncbi:MAG: radical SAM/SPASM domain-containing protein [Elusimicrobiota bacterium]
MGQGVKKPGDGIRAWMMMQLKPDHVAAADVRSAAVETGAACNLRCPFCRTGNGTGTLSKDFLSVERFAAILDRLGSGLKFLAVMRWGEPLLNPNIAGILTEASSRGVATLLHSNLSLPSFDEEAARGLVSSGLTELSFSCDGASQETYGQYRVGGNFRLALSKVALLLEARRRLPAKLPIVRWQFLVHRGNRHELKKASVLARRLGVKIEFRKLWAPPEWTAEPAEIASRLPARAALFEYPVCLQAWEMPGVHSDGTVLPCCVVADARHGLGNIFDEPLERIWNKPLVVAMRRYLRAGIRSEMALPCYGCARDPNRRAPARS